MGSGEVIDLGEIALSVRWLDLFEVSLDWLRTKQARKEYMTARLTLQVPMRQTAARHSINQESSQPFQRLTSNLPRKMLVLTSFRR